MKNIKTDIWRLRIVPFIILFSLSWGSVVLANPTETIQVADLRQTFKNLGNKIKSQFKKTEDADGAVDVDDTGNTEGTDDEQNDPLANAFSAGPELREIQQRLSNLGYNPGPIDGKPGAKTQGAISSFQQANGLPENGHASTALLSELRTLDSTAYEAPVEPEPDDQTADDQLAKSQTVIVETVETKATVPIEPEVVEAGPGLEQEVASSENEKPEQILLATNENIELEALDDFPYLLIVYKYAPEAFTDTLLLEQTKIQIEKDQSNYLNGNPDSSHVYVFSKSQVEGRVVEFAANELLPVYKKYLNNLVDLIPDQFSFSEFKQVNQLQFDHTKKQLHSEQRQAFLMKFTVWQLPELKGTAQVSSIPESFSSPKLLKPRKVKLVLNRNLTIPPITMDPGVAERMWATQEKSSCSQHIVEYTNKGLTLKEAEAAVTKCTKELTQANGVLATANIAIDRVEATENEYVIFAKLVHVDVEIARSKWHETYAAENFPTIKHTEAIENSELVAGQQASPQNLEATEKLHVLGIRIGMTLSEADTFIRKAMPVGSVYSMERSEATSKIKSYGRARIYISEDGLQLASLNIEKKKNSTEEEVLGIVRSVYFDANVNTSELSANLTKFYGEPARAQNNFMNWGNAEQWCGSLGTKIDSMQDSNVRLIEGKEIERNLYTIAWDRNPGKPQDGNPYKNECSYTLVSNYLTGEKEFRQGLANHDLYYDRYVQLLAE